MSLINEALKKAQAQQNAGQRPAMETAPPTDPKPPHGDLSATTPPRKSSFFSLIVLLGSIVIAFAAIVGLVVWGVLTLREDNPETAQQTPTSSQQSAVQEAKQANPEKESLPPIEFKVNAQDAQNKTPLIATPNAPEASGELSTRSSSPDTITSTPSPSDQAVIPTPKPAPVEEKAPTPVAKSTVPLIASTPKPAPSTQAPPAPEAGIPDALVQDFIERLQVRGIMSGGKKALIYNEETQRSGAYGTGSTINNELRIRILAITEHSITFIDHAGVTYLKQF